MLQTKKTKTSVDSLNDDFKTSHIWLNSYFGSKTNSVKYVRNTTAFHYEGLDFGQSLRNLAKGDRNIFLETQSHPMNSIYFVGSAVVFRTLFAKIAEDYGGTVGLNHEERVRKGQEIVIADANSVHFHMHKLLYGLIKALVEKALGSTLKPVGFLSVQGVVPEEVKLPMFLDMGSFGKTPPPTV